MYSVLAIAVVVITSTYAIEWKDNWAKDCYFVGNDLTSEIRTAEGCRESCWRTSGCTHYFWHERLFSLGICFMKKNVVFKTDAIEKVDNYECGIVQPRFKGYLTTKWDCCKPSCSWNGKTSVSKPVASCSYDGSTVLNNSDIESGCSHGDAFPCNYYQPWTSNGIYFGFATARVFGKTVADLCCRCFVLKFTSQPLIKKEMFIQVINVDEDSTEQEESNFEIYVPGTGDSNSSGCPAQWGESRAGAAWKINNFGVPKTETHCQMLPWQLFEGCEWRFKWLQNADKPTFQFGETECPPELTSKSGCVRQ